MIGIAARAYVTASLLAVPLATETFAQPFVEEAGQVVIEVEAEPAMGSWDESQAIEGYTGTSYYRWGGSNQSQGGNGLLTYEVVIQDPGNYQFMFRSRITEGENSTEGNDTFVALSGEPIDGQQTIGSNVWTKAYMNRLDRWTWNTANKDHDPQPLRQFFSAGLHTIKLSGRSGGHAVDRFILFKYEEKPYENAHAVASATQEEALTALPQSSRQSAGTTTSTTTTTLPVSECGDATEVVAGGEARERSAAHVTATDALFVLQVTVGIGTCLPCVCDVDDSGGVSATDALIMLQSAVDPSVELQCPPCE